MERECTQLLDEPGVRGRGQRVGEVELLVEIRRPPRMPPGHPLLPDVPSRPRSSVVIWTKGAPWFLSTYFTCLTKRSTRNISQREALSSSWYVPVHLKSVAWEEKPVHQQTKHLH